MYNNLSGLTTREIQEKINQISLQLTRGIDLGMNIEVLRQMEDIIDEYNDELYNRAALEEAKEWKKNPVIFDSEVDLKQNRKNLDEVRSKKQDYKSEW